MRENQRAESIPITLSAELWVCFSPQVHERAHTGDRPYRCDFPSCGKAFATGNNLNEVMVCFQLRAKGSRST